MHFANWEIQKKIICRCNKFENRFENRQQIGFLGLDYNRPKIVKLVYFYGGDWFWWTAQHLWSGFPDGGALVGWWALTLMFCITFIADMLMLASLVLPIGVKCPACYFSVSIAFVRSNSRSVQIHRVVLFCFVEELDASHFCSLFLYYFLSFKLRHHEKSERNSVVTFHCFISWRTRIWLTPRAICPVSILRSEFSQNLKYRLMLG